MFLGKKCPTFGRKKSAVAIEKNNKTLLGPLCESINNHGVVELSSLAYHQILNTPPIWKTLQQYTGIPASVYTTYIA